MGYTILVVDDSATTRALIKRTIQLARLPIQQIFDAADGQDALDLLEGQSVDLILADLHMPVMDGQEMTRRVLANPATAAIPVVIVSADPNTQRIEDLKRQGVRGHLRKPFTPEDIRRLVTEILGAIHA